MNCLYRFMIDSFCWPNVVAVRALRTLSLGFARFASSVVFGLKVIPRSNVVPRIFVVGVTGIWLPFRVRIGCTLYSLLKGVITVIEDFCADTDILLVESQFSSWARYNCKLLAALVMIGSVEIIVRSSA